MDSPAGGLHTVIETPTYLRAALRAGMTKEDLATAVDIVSRNPLAGGLIQGSGGCRKLRIPGHGKGKSGGFRTIHYFAGSDVPVFLLTVFSKSDRANLTKAQVNDLAELTRILAGTYRNKPGHGERR